jgi:hypothetical protein
MVEHSLRLREMVAVIASEQSRVNSSSGRGPGLLILIDVYELART